MRCSYDYLFVQIISIDNLQYTRNNEVEHSKLCLLLKFKKYYN